MTPGWAESADPGAVETRWWRSLGDPTLSALIEAALERNLDIKAATERLAEVRADRDAARGAGLPQGGAEAAATENGLSRNGLLPVGRIPGISRDYSLFDAGFDASWELDLWGRNRRALQAAGARVEAAAAGLAAVRLQVIAETARAYIDLRDAQARQASAGADAEARAQIADLVRRRFEGGEASRFDAARAESQARATRAALPGLESDARSAAYRLALLTGRPPEATTDLAATATPLPAAPATVGAGLRSDLLRRRPDVVQAERTLAAATADVGVATADLFPKVTLSGALAQQARNAGDLASADSTRFQAGPSLSWPVFSLPGIRARIRSADARSREAAATYEKAVLAALSNSETALNRYAAVSAQLTDRERAREQSALALELARQRYRAGEEDLIAVLDSQSEFSAAEQQALAARAARLTALVSLYKSLGGGWPL